MPEFLKDRGRWTRVRVFVRTSSLTRDNFFNASNTVLACEVSRALTRLIKNGS
jgi:hypothetical protein